MLSSYDYFMEDSMAHKRNAVASHKRGDKRNEEAVKHRKIVDNFKQSKDIHEDRGTARTKLGRSSYPASKR